MQHKWINGILAAAVTVALGACSATAPVVDRAQPSAAELLHTRLLPLEGGRNFRDLGGYETVDGKHVKWGKLYRSGVLTNLTAHDYDYLRDRNINTIVDFRSTEERSSEPDNWREDDVTTLAWDYDMGNWQAAFAKVFSKPGFGKEDVVHMMDEGYVGLVRQQTPAYRAMFQKLIDGDEPLLFHCSAGKDRTGVGAALILTALGVERKTIMQDYLLSTEVLKKSDMMQLPKDASAEQQQMYAFFSRLPEDVRDAVAGVEPSYLESAFAEMERESGSVDNFIREKLDVDATELAQLRATYLQ